MAILTSVELAQLRKQSEAVRVPASHVRGDVDAALQAIEDYFAGSRTVRPANSVDAAIEAAAVGKFTSRQKDELIRVVNRLRGT